MQIYLAWQYLHDMAITPFTLSAKNRLHWLHNNNVISLG